MKIIPKHKFVLIIGAMKCGTTSLYFHLARHPNICECISKEPGFFSDKQKNRIKVQQYEDLWKFDPTIHQYVLEASTAYTKFPSESVVPQKIQEYGLNPKFIYIVRNPFERIVSHYNFMRTKPDFNPNKPLTSKHFISLSNYYLQLSRYHKLFPKDSFLVLDYDHLKREPELIVRRTYQFLGLSANSTPNNWEIHNVTPSSNKKYLSENEKEIIFEQLHKDMGRFRLEYGFDVAKWGF